MYKLDVYHNGINHLTTLRFQVTVSAFNSNLEIFRFPLSLVCKRFNVAVTQTSVSSENQIVSSMSCSRGYSFVLYYPVLTYTKQEEACNTKLQSIVHLLAVHW